MQVQTTVPELTSVPQYASMDNLRFMLFDVHHIEALSQYEHFGHFDRSTIDMTIDSAKQIADKHMFPYFEEMDRFGCQYEDGKVTIHPHMRTIMQEMGQGGWIGSTASFDIGGMQMPAMLYTAGEFIFEAANNSVVGYPGLTSGAARLIYSFGSPELIDTYVPHMFAGKWQGTMALTEPESGSSLSDIVTSAKETAEGHYLIDGQKIFISSGDHDAVDNVVHLMLARIEGAPAGTKGISLFVVPKMRPDENGNLVPNDVTTAGLFHKMGQVGYATAHLLMGDKGDCRGYLVGKPHQGLRYMFQMMNAARISVGVGGAAIASAAYYASLRYALERSQGRRMGSSESKSLIIHHADVRRMLFLQKAVVEGSLSLVMECAKLEDLVKVTEGEEKMKHHLLLELLTPIVKTFPTEYGIYAVSNGLQVLGGYGFLKDYALEQLYRDIRITAIYEGTTGIQSLDLLGRKVMMNEGQAVKLLAENIQGTIGQAMAFDSLKPYAEQLGKELARVNDVMQHLIGVAMSGDQERFASDANLFMEMFSLNVIAWQWLKQGVVAAGKLANDAPTGDELTFLESKLRTLQYFFAYELVKTKGLATRLKDERVITIADSERELLV